MPIPRFLADQLTLSQAREHIMPTTLNKYPPPPRFSDLPTALTLSALRHCRHHQKLMIFPLAWYCTFSVDPYCSC